MKRLIAAAALAVAVATAAPAQPPYAHVGRIERLAPGLDALIDPGAPLEKLAEGFRWSEGPVWIGAGGRNGYLLFSDVPANRMYRWSAEGGLTVFMDPSGHPGPDTSAFREPGTNGLIRGPGNTIYAADHGSRAIVRIDLATREKIVMADRYQGRRFSSPNDLVLDGHGAIWFTDPPYGLAGMNESPLKEQPVNGVYRRGADDMVRLIDGELSFPNGIILSPDQGTLYVANSDPRRAIIMAYSLDGYGRVTSRRVFADMTAEVAPERPGLPDGMAIDRAGNLFATGPGGVHVFAPDGNLLGRISTGTGIANCKFGEDGQTLFLTSNNMLVRVRTRTTGLGY
jgi:gluconolactonase